MTEKLLLSPEAAPAAAEDALLRVWARVLREAGEADQASRPALHVVSDTRRPRPGPPRGQK